MALCCPGPDTQASVSADEIGGQHGTASQEFGDAVAQCVQHCADERPSAEHLLRHKFFRLAARHPQHLIQRLWRQVPEGSESAARPMTDSEAGKLIPFIPGMPASSIEAACIYTGTVGGSESRLSIKLAECILAEAPAQTGSFGTLGMCCLFRHPESP